MRAIWTVARRELRALFDQPTGFILLIVFLAFNDFLFFRQAYLFHVASIRPMVELFPWLWLFFVPAVTMRVLAEEARTGTIEIVLAQPLTELEWILGKFLGALLFVWVWLALTIPIPIGLSLGANLHSGVIIAQYVGAALLAVAFTAVGVWSSSLTRNQITAFIIGVAVMFIMILVGLDPTLVGLPPVLGAIAARLGVLSHFRDIARGVIDLRDVIYFLSVAAIFLSLAYLALMSRKLSAHGDSLRRLRLGITLAVAAFVVLNLFGSRIGGRLDLTPGNAYTLSRATRDLVRSIDDIITIKLFMSKELPPEVALLRRDINDVLRDYRTAADGNIRLVVQDPAEDEDVASEARSLGIPPVQFNVVGESEFSVRDGYLGLAVQYADESEVIPFIQTTDDLEYRLSSYIRGITDSSRATVAYHVPSRELMPGRTFRALREELSQTYGVTTLTLVADSQPAIEADVLVLIGSPDSLTAEQRETFREFFERGGGALIMAGGMSLSTQQQFASPTEMTWNQVLEPFGVSVRSDMVFDLMSNEQVALPTQFGRLLMPYPLWVRAVSTRAAVVNQEIEGSFMPWSSSVDTSGAVAGTVTPLFVSSPGGGVQDGPVMLSPQRSPANYPQDNLAPQLMGVMVNPLAVDQPSGPSGRVVLTGSTEFVMDSYLSRNLSNLAFALNAVDWLAEDESLISIRAKNRTPPMLIFPGDMVRDLVKYGNLIGVPVLVVLVALLRLFRRRRETRRTYGAVAAQESV